MEEAEEVRSKRSPVSFMWNFRTKFSFLSLDPLEVAVRQLGQPSSQPFAVDPIQEELKIALLQSTWINHDTCWIGAGQRPTDRHGRQGFDAKGDERHSFSSTSVC